jgi:polyisoprenoid-binding protein YceI
MKYATSLLATAAALTVPAAVALGDNAVSPRAGLSEWAIDATHARIGFSVPHMVVSSVDGDFKQFSGKVMLDEKNPQNSQLEFTADVASIDTGVADRDKHLRSGDFFDAAKFPQISFKSTKISKAGHGYKIKGDLTIRGVTKQVTLDATLSDAVTNPWGKQVRAARITGKIHREDFGVSWNKALDKGGLVVGSDVSIDVKLELNK